MSLLHLKVFLYNLSYQLPAAVHRCLQLFTGVSRCWQPPADDRDITSVVYLSVIKCFGCNQRYKPNLRVPEAKGKSDWILACMAAL